MKGRDILKQQAIRSKSESLMVSYRHEKQSYRSKREYFTDKIASFEGDLKNTWKTINNILNKKSKTTNITTLNIDDKHISNTAGIAEAMNNCFCTIGATLSEKIPQKIFLC